MKGARSVKQSTVNVMGIDLVVHQLDNGQRVVEAKSVEQLFAAIGGPDSLTAEEAAHIMNSVYPEVGQS